MALEDRLEEIEHALEVIDGLLAQPDVASDLDALRRMGQDRARLEPVVAGWRRLRETRRELAGARRMRDEEPDGELHDMARDEVERLESDETRLVEELRVLLLPRDPHDERDVIIEIRAGTGGEEAALFASQLYRMYVRYAERHRWTPELVTASESGGMGGLREVIFEIHGSGAYSRLKFEGGVHRVQRVPETESSGRIHTSTATVAVLPEAEDVDVEINEANDLQIDVYRSSGPGGQSVVAIQDEKSQHKNKAKALAVLRARLLELKQREAHDAEAAVRRSMVGSGERAEKIRTYNFSQDRVTDHRIGMDLHNLPGVLDGDLDRLVEALIQTEQADRLATFDEDGTGKGTEQ